MGMLRLRSAFRLLPAVGLIVLVSLIPERRARAQCYQQAPYDMSHITEMNTDGCGTNKWQLQVMFRNVIYPEGSATVTGYCNQPYYDCGCAYWPLEPHSGSLQFVSQLYSDSYTIYWVNTSYTPATYTSCSNPNTCDGSQQHLHTSITQVGYDPFLWCD